MYPGSYTPANYKLATECAFTFTLATKYSQEYIIKREGEYPTPLYPSVVTLSEVHDLYNVIHMYWNFTACTI